MATQDDILARALEIMNARGVSLAEAAMLAEEDLRPAPAAIPEFLDVRIRLKPRVMSWVVRIFGGHASLSVEERLGAYLSGHMNKVRIQTIRADEDAASITKGEAVTVPRHKMDEAVK